MSVSSTVRQSWRYFHLALNAMVWIAVTIWLGASAMVTALHFLFRVRRVFSTFMRCARGHRVELYGTFRCPQCKAVREGRVFDPCSVCGARSIYIDCLRCGLAVKDPLRW